jgi:hypothetical protein
MVATGRDDKGRDDNGGDDKGRGDKGRDDNSGSFGPVPMGPDSARDFIWRGNWPIVP